MTCHRRINTAPPPNTVHYTYCTTHSWIGINTDLIEANDNWQRHLDTAETQTMRDFVAAVGDIQETTE